MLGIVIGVAAVIVMVAIGQGARAKIEAQIRTLGTNMIVVTPGSTALGGASQGANTFNRLSIADAEKIRREGTLLTGVSPVIVTRAQVIGGAGNWRTEVDGVSTDYLTIRNWGLQSGDAFGSRVAAASQGVKAATGGRWPTVSLSAGYSSSYNSAGDLSLGDQLDQRRGGSIAIGIAIPLFDRGQVSLAAQQARIDEENARLTLETQRQTVGVDVRRASLDYDAARQQLAAAEAQLKASNLAVTTAQKRYEAGAGTLVEVTQARATQGQAASSEITARYAVVFQAALMSYYTGELDPAHLTV